MSKCKFKLSRIVFLALSLTILFLNSPVWSQKAAIEEKREAEKAWEALIRAKGGRERLHSITNMLTEFLTETRLDIFPDKRWSFGNYLDGTPYVDRYDAAKPPGEFATLGSPNGKNENVAYILSGVIRSNRIPFLLETKWNKPELVRVRRIKEKKQLLDVIETIVEGDRMDFVYEPEEMLVREVRFYGKSGLIINYVLSNYTTIDGIKMPQEFEVGDNINNFKPKPPGVPIRFQFNVEYDPRLFERPLELTTREAWKPKKPAD
jgi:hypothetical protein